MRSSIELGESNGPFDNLSVSVSRSQVSKERFCEMAYVEDHNFLSLMRDGPSKSLFGIDLMSLVSERACRMS